MKCCAVCERPIDPYVQRRACSGCGQPVCVVCGEDRPAEDVRCPACAEDSKIGGAR